MTYDFDTIIDRIETRSTKWLKFEDLAKIQKPLKKKILIFFEKPNCPYCQEMKDNTFTIKEIIDVINKNFYAVKFNF